MSRTHTNAHRGLLLGIAAVAAIVMVTIFFLASYLNAGHNTEPISMDDETSPSATSSIAIGGVGGPTDGELADESDQTPSLDPGKAMPGDRVQVVNGNGITRLYSDANLNALVMDQLTEGEFLIVLEPSSEYDAYPVDNDGIQWIRVRAVDGLVGWVDARKLAE